ncbi:hypothetical protein FA13DRAFT_1715257 [Coprinellus micaceus]|uniref:Uncharacterized protein n=1 Tax=Coprinellus micaceus TaxID=71717 RepID=A0A4Y7SPJ7_COPMI|nr:hypothetical protein FA13DRAFT_1715257 [Coprinellus micaceus]
MDGMVGGGHVRLRNSLHSREHKNGVRKTIRPEGVQRCTVSLQVPFLFCPRLTTSKFLSSGKSAASHPVTCFCGRRFMRNPREEPCGTSSIGEPAKRGRRNHMGKCSHSEPTAENNWTREPGTPNDWRCGACKPISKGFHRAGHEVTQVHGHSLLGSQVHGVKHAPSPPISERTEHHIVIGVALHPAHGIAHPEGTEYLHAPLPELAIPFPPGLDGFRPADTREEQEIRKAGKFCEDLLMGTDQGVGWLPDQGPEGEEGVDTGRELLRCIYYSPLTATCREQRGGRERGHWMTLRGVVPMARLTVRYTRYPYPLPPVCILRGADRPHAVAPQGQRNHRLPIRAISLAVWRSQWTSVPLAWPTTTALKTLIRRAHSMTQAATQPPAEGTRGVSPALPVLLLELTSGESRSSASDASSRPSQRFQRPVEFADLLSAAMLKSTTPPCLFTTSGEGDTDTESLAACRARWFPRHHTNYPIPKARCFTCMNGTHLTISPSVTHSHCSPARLVPGIEGICANTTTPASRRFGLRRTLRACTHPPTILTTTLTTTTYATIHNPRHGADSRLGHQQHSTPHATSATLPHLDLPQPSTNGRPPADSVPQGPVRCTSPPTPHLTVHDTSHLPVPGNPKTQIHLTQRLTGDGYGGGLGTKGRRDDGKRAATGQARTGECGGGKGGAEEMRGWEEECESRGATVMTGEGGVAYGKALRVIATPVGWARGVREWRDGGKDEDNGSDERVEDGGGSDMKLSGERWSIEREGEEGRDAGVRGHQRDALTEDCERKDLFRQRPSRAHERRTTA